MTPATTRSGISAFDAAFGGFYLKRPVLVSGRHNSGKFVVAMQFLAKMLQSGEKVVFFTSRDPDRVLVSLNEENIDGREAIDSGQLVLCPYSSMQHEGDEGDMFAPLPFPQALDELGEIVSEHSPNYAIFYPVVPWVAIEPLDKVPYHVENFVGALEKLGLTSLLFLPKAASPAAQDLVNTLCEVCPINIVLDARNFGAEYVMRVTKFQGAPGGVQLPWEKTLDLLPGVGFVTRGESAAGQGGNAAMVPGIGVAPATTAPDAGTAKRKPKFHALLTPALPDLSAVAGAKPAAPPSGPAPLSGPLPAPAPLPSPGPAKSPGATRGPVPFLMPAPFQAPADKAPVDKATAGNAPQKDPSSKRHSANDGKPHPSFSDVLDMTGTTAGGARGPKPRQARQGAAPLRIFQTLPTKPDAAPLRIPLGGDGQKPAAKPRQKTSFSQVL